MSQYKKTALVLGAGGFIGSCNTYYWIEEQIKQ
jgi:hypothetical protein